jgi:hypothetical protein
MSLVSAFFRSDPYRKIRPSEREGRLAQHIFKASQFMRGVRVEMRFGELSRAPLRLIRFEILAETAECDWLARPSDAWDEGLSRNIQQRHISLQALRDAIDMRALMFDLMPQLETAHFRVYRETPDVERAMIITGTTHRNDQSSRDVHSLVMRAKVLGFRFNLEGDILCALGTSDK